MARGARAGDERPDLRLNKFGDVLVGRRVAEGPEGREEKAGGSRGGREVHAVAREALGRVGDALCGGRDDAPFARRLVEGACHKEKRE